ncbi:MAG: hypothetical protein WAV90_03830 [Gordonia amarae]
MPSELDDDLDTYRLVVTGHDRVSGKATRVPWHVWPARHRSLLWLSTRVYSRVNGRRISISGTAESGEIRVVEPSGSTVLHVDWSAELIRFADAGT